MATLNDAALQQLEWAGLTEAEWIEWNEGPGATEWRGDACGCSDDRCIGYHHDVNEECGCLPALLEERERSYTAAREAQPIWDAYQQAIADKDEAAVRAARERAGEWVRTYGGSTVTSFSLDELVNGHAGISVTTAMNDQRWLQWKAGAECLVRWMSETDPV